jgi:molybdopterin converting factor small subunit
VAAAADGGRVFLQEVRLGVGPVEVTVEFYGIPRQRAGRSELTVAARTVGDALAAVQSACPGLEGLLSPDGKLASHYLLSLDGQEFAADERLPLKQGQRLLLLSADAGG